MMATVPCAHEGFFADVLPELFELAWSIKGRAAAEGAWREEVVRGPVLSRG